MALLTPLAAAAAATAWATRLVINQLLSLRTYEVR
jgi:hypothetical protein